MPVNHFIFLGGMVMVGEKVVTTVAEKIDADQDIQTRLMEENSAVIRNIAGATDIVELNRQTQAIEETSGILDLF